VRLVYQVRPPCHARYGNAELAGSSDQTGGVPYHHDGTTTLNVVLHRRQKSSTSLADLTWDDAFGRDVRTVFL
jgi:hypothetical protein